MAAHIPPKQFINPCNDPNLNVPPVVGSSRLGEPGVFGLHCAGGNGVHGHSDSGVAVRGDSEGGTGFRATARPVSPCEATASNF